MKRSFLVLLFVYPLVICGLALFLGHRMVMGVANSTLSPSTKSVNTTATGSMNDPQACVLAFLEAHNQLAEMRLRVSGGEQVRPLLSESLYGGWAKSFSTISGKEVAEPHKTGPDSWNVKVKLMRMSDQDPQTLTFVVQKMTTGGKDRAFVIEEVREACSACDGSGMRKCFECGGTGTQQVLVEDKNDYGYVVGRRYDSSACYECDGKGKSRCEVCGKKGYRNLAPDLVSYYDGESNSVVQSE